MYIRVCEEQPHKILDIRSAPINECLNISYCLLAVMNELDSEEKFVMIIILSWLFTMFN